MPLEACLSTQAARDATWPMSDPSGRCWGICIDFNPVAAVQSAISTVSNAASSVAKAVVKIATR
jgi:hypothetical protein